YPWMSTLNGMHKLVQQEMILLQPSEQIVQALNFYRHHLSELNVTFEGIATYSHAVKQFRFLESVLFKPGALKQYLENSPHAAIQLGEFFKESIASQKLNGNARCLLIDLGIKVKQYCGKCAPEYSEAFPNFVEILKSSIKSDEQTQCDGGYI